MNTPFLNNAFHLPLRSLKNHSQMTNKKNKAHLTLLEVKMEQKGMSMNQQLYYLLALGVSVVHAAFPANRATFLEERQLSYTFQRWAKV